MSSFLQKSEETFRSNVISASSKVSNKRTLAPPAPVSAPSPSPSNASSTGGDRTSKDKDQKRKREDHPNRVWSQPEITGHGNDLGTQITYIISYLKEKQAQKTFQEILEFLSRTNATERDKRTISGILRQHTSVEWRADPKLKAQHWDSGTFRHRPKINVRDKTQLLAYLQQLPDAKGVSVAELKDGWPGCEKPIEELEEAHQILVTRTKKDNHARYVWPDDKSLVHSVDDEFKLMWHKTELPDADNLVRKLLDAGQKPASEDPAKRIKAPPKQKEKKKRPARKGGRTTNTHMAHLLRDYDHLKR